jgi:predicted RNA-binding protein with RPS1 domain
MFVDVGAKRDGLVHVKDISRNYFINNHQSVRDYVLTMLFFFKIQHSQLLPEL